MALLVVFLSLKRHSRFVLMNLMEFCIFKLFKEANLFVLILGKIEQGLNLSPIHKTEQGCFSEAVLKIILCMNPRTTKLRVFTGYCDIEKEIILIYPFYSNQFYAAFKSTSLPVIIYLCQLLRNSWHLACLYFSIFKLKRRFPLEALLNQIQSFSACQLLDIFDVHYVSSQTMSNFTAPQQLIQQSEHREWI